MVRTIFARLAVILGFTSIAGAGLGQHPTILAKEDQKSKILEKIKGQPWAARCFQDLKSRVDPFLAKLEEDPGFLTSRLAMNWAYHYTTPIVSRERLVGGTGNAPIPTPRFAGARNWATDWVAPERIEDFRPFNDTNGLIYLYNVKAKKFDWVHSGDTGRTIEEINQRLMGVAQDSAFLYWLTGNERYAKLSSDLIWTYLSGFSHVLPPQVPASEPETQQIIGATSFEVIHEGIVEQIATAYDFVYGYMASHSPYDVKLVQAQIRRIVDRVVAGGFPTRNWNLHKARIISVGGLALEHNGAYEDGKGREYYLNIAIDARLPRQVGLSHVLKTEIDPVTALWPEAAGYAFGSIKNIVLTASILEQDPRGRELLQSPLLYRAVFSLPQLTYPNGRSNGVGDSANEAIDPITLELMLAAARDKADRISEGHFATLLRREIESRRYARGGSVDPLLALTRFVDDVPQGQSADAVTPTFYSDAINTLVMRNGTLDEAIAASFYGTAGAHAHVNGLAIELFGAGQVIGPDPGAGQSYWEKDHTEYYGQLPAHNTVIPNGRASYSAGGSNGKPIRFTAIEPASGSTPLTSSTRYATAKFEYVSPIGASQQRTLALIRLDAEHAFFYDVFRSKTTQADPDEAEYHDYLFHGIGQLVSATAGATSGALSLTPSNDLAAFDMLPGYRYFRDVRSAKLTGSGAVQLGLSVTNARPSIKLWLPDSGERKLYVANAPAVRAARALPSNLSSAPSPTILLRRSGEAWTRPFVTIYEPFDAGKSKPAIQSAKALRVTGSTQGLSATQLLGNFGGKAFSMTLLQDVDASGRAVAGGITFEGNFGTVLQRGNQVERLYLGQGRAIGTSAVRLTAVGAQSIDCAVWQEAGIWRYSSSGTARLVIGKGKGAKTYLLKRGIDLPVR